MIVQGKCTSCGASIPVDKTQVSGVCNYCQSSYLVEKAVSAQTNNFQPNFQPVIHINNTQAQSQTQTQTVVIKKRRSGCFDAVMIICTGGLWIIWMIIRPK